MHAHEGRGSRPAPDTADIWASWLLRHRFGGDREAWERMLPELHEFRDNVLRGAQIALRDVVLDVGCGDGLLGVGALPLVGVAGKVIFSDVSNDLLARCRELVTELGSLDQCRFVNTGLPDLSTIPSESVDVVMTRSVLIYVADKPRSFAALHRVLRNGGRLSIFEPINSFGRPGPADRLAGWDVTDLEPIAEKVKQAARRYMPDPNPMVDFDERDLLAWVVAAGFEEVQLDYRAEIGSESGEISWEAFIQYSPNPLVPPWGAVLEEALTDAERNKLTAHLQEQIAAGRRRRRKFASAYLTATRRG